jgi:hypothetical protein
MIGKTKPHQYAKSCFSEYGRICLPFRLLDCAKEFRHRVPIWCCRDSVSLFLSTKDLFMA